MFVEFLTFGTACFQHTVSCWKMPCWGMTGHKMVAKFSLSLLFYIQGLCVCPAGSATWPNSWAAYFFLRVAGPLLRLWCRPRRMTSLLQQCHWVGAGRCQLLRFATRLTTTHNWWGIPVATPTMIWLATIQQTHPKLTCLLKVCGPHRIHTTCHASPLRPTEMTSQTRHPMRCGPQTQQVGTEHYRHDYQTPWHEQSIICT